MRPWWPPSQSVTANEVSLRQGIAALRSRLEDRSVAATRESGEQIRWLYAQLKQRVDEVRAAAQRSRWQWIIADHRLLLIGLIAWACATVGLTSAAITLNRAGGLQWWHATPAAVAALSASAVWLIVAIARRGYVRYQAALADEIERDLSELDGLIPRPVEWPRAWVVTPNNATSIRGRAIGDVPCNRLAPIDQPIRPPMVCNDVP